jgi:hypothetical protein
MLFFISTEESYSQYGNKFNLIAIKLCFYLEWEKRVLVID